MAGRHRRRRKTIAVFTLAILALIAVGIFVGQAQVQMALDDFIWSSGPMAGGSASS
jgi:hypothetical protein